MAAEDSSQEKTEEPSSKRLREAREEGQVVRSRELNTTAILLAGTAALLSTGEQLAKSLEKITRYNLVVERTAVFDPYAMVTHLYTSFMDILYTLFPIFVVFLLAALLGPMALGGWLFSPQVFMPKLSRLDPLSGLKRMFSMRALVDLLKAFAKFVVIAIFAVIVLHKHFLDMMSLANEDIRQAMHDAVWIVGWSFLALSSAMLLLVIVDVPIQLWEHNKQLRMTKQDLKDEYKDSEGKPEVKMRIRQLQRQLAQKRMMEQVPKADVVITNPEHFAVALKYNPLEASAPIVIAKGTDFLALKIREIAQKHMITVIPAPPLARAIYYSTDIDKEVPKSLYIAVAQILAYVYQLRRYEEGDGKKPNDLPELEIPDDLQH